MLPGFGAALAALMMTLALAPSAVAHQRVDLGPADSTPQSGPLLVDGTVSFAVLASVARGQQRGFRLALDKGDRLALQLLIFDEAPANALPATALPEVTVTDPAGRRLQLAINERTGFYEPYSKRNYLYLSRVERAAVPGVYRVVIRGRSSEPVQATVAVGYREVPGRVID